MLSAEYVETRNNFQCLELAQAHIQCLSLPFFLSFAVIHIIFFILYRCSSGNISSLCWIKYTGAGVIISDLCLLLLFIKQTCKIGIISIILQRRIQRLRKVKWLMTYLKPQSSQIGSFQLYLYTSEAYAKHDMWQRVSNKTWGMRQHFVRGNQFIVIQFCVQIYSLPIPNCTIHLISLNLVLIIYKMGLTGRSKSINVPGTRWKERCIKEPTVFGEV